MTAPTTDGDTDDLQPPPRERRMTKRMFRDSVALIPGDAGWWHQDGGDTFRKLGDALLAHGFSTDDALQFLESAYGAVAAEFGS